MLSRAKSKRDKDFKRLLGYNRVKTLEEKLARDFCYKHSVQASRNHDPDEIKETIFVGSPVEMFGVVLVELGELRSGEIPDYPQGLVIHDSRGTGAFD